MGTTDNVLALCRRWVTAELAGDATLLDRLGTDDFTLVGPAGFVLDRTQWLARFTPGALRIDRLDWAPDSVREYGDAAVVVGIQDQEASFAGRRADGRFRVTHTAVRQDGEWLLATIQFSPLGVAGPLAAAPQQEASAR
ncbi:nuclear transport factor 2 family protein [Nocardia wallacei]|uniref:nuclear transport factor 2 family protein n=1 Tax=Nocardia wallacei TaxID=480035 RepID=UPI0024581CE1|nr:nuclear transport factor 2 family protein [Nocardia wallacei]